MFWKIKRLPKPPIPDSAWAALETIWFDGFTVSSNFARECAEEVALLASLGFISTVLPDGSAFTRTWRVTPTGIQALAHRKT